MSSLTDERHQMRFEANKYGSFAANNVGAGQGDGADDDAYADGDGANGMHHQRVISQRVDHDDEENGLDEE